MALSKVTVTTDGPMYGRKDKLATDRRTHRNKRTNVRGEIKFPRERLEKNRILHLGKTRLLMCIYSNHSYIGMLIFPHMSKSESMLA